MSNSRTKKDTNNVGLRASSAQLYMILGVFQEIWQTIGQNPAERGGVLGGDSSFK